MPACLISMHILIKNYITLVTIVFLCPRWSSAFHFFGIFSISNRFFTDLNTNIFSHIYREFGFVLIDCHSSNHKILKDFQLSTSCHEIFFIFLYNKIHKSLNEAFRLFDTLVLIKHLIAKAQVSLKSKLSKSSHGKSVSSSG